MIKKIFFILLLLSGIISSCSRCDVNFKFENNLKNKEKEKTVKTVYINYEKVTKEYFENILIITHDSCLKWNLPVTPFKIEYPNKYKIQKQIDKLYLILDYIENQNLIERVEITYTLNVHSKKGVNILFKKFKEELSELYKQNCNIIKQDQIIVDSIRYFVLYSTIDTDGLNLSEFKGKYLMIDIIYLSKIKKYESLNLRFTRKLNDNKYEMTDEEIKILKSFRFIYPSLR